ncbi:MAG TPA: hypothetical protein VFX48_07815 [Saprospiraceae bacterium]|nr:hypothetical protein [Saprospiraceae bacterium]
MKISGFTFMRNTSSLYYPFVESIQSILPLVDEFVIAMGDNRPDDRTLEELKRIPSEKIRIIPTIWDLEKYPGGTVYAQQTDLAKQACTGDWLFYLQSDEVVHEKYLDEIRSACQGELDHPEVEGLLFRYKHFWGDYKHYVSSHVWYPKEIRIIRNHPDIHSWRDAQSFKRIPDFDGKNYRQKAGAFKLQVKMLEACIYHYGWVRPPRMMQSKNRQMDSYYHKQEKVDQMYQRRDTQFDYGNLNAMEHFDESHPAVMQSFISRFDWQDDLHYDADYRPQREPLKHERLKYRAISWVEKNLLNGNQLFGYRNWKILK